MQKIPHDQDLNYDYRTKIVCSFEITDFGERCVCAVGVMRVVSAAVMSAVLLAAAPAMALPALTSCEGGGRGGRMGLCAGSVPINLRGSNYIRLNNS
jgi:hypothetical protein